MNPRHNSQIVASVEDIAADWLVRRDAGLSVSDAVQFAQWSASDPRHAQAIADLEITWSVLLHPQRTGTSKAVRQEMQDRASRRFRRRASWSAGALAAAAAVAFAFIISPRLNRTEGESAAASTVAPRPDRMTLADGSTVELNAAAEIVVNFTRESRSVRLVHGEAHFEVAKDPARPFVVSAGGTDVRAVGTQFLVSYSGDAIKVLVTEGKVAVDRHGVDSENAPLVAAEPILLPAGTHLDLPAKAIAENTPKVSPTTASDVSQALAWRSMRAEFNGTPLGEALAIFNQRNALQLSLAAPEWSSRRLTGVFWTNDAEGFARLLEQTLGLRAVRAGSTIRLDPSD